MRFPVKEEVFTMAELFLYVKTTIWSELSKENNINSFRRELQRIFLTRMYKMVLHGNEYPNDAVSLSFEMLNVLKKDITASLNSDNLDKYTRAHLHDCIHRIESVLDAKINLN